jgi:hypothetical protein
MGTCSRRAGHLRDCLEDTRAEALVSLARTQRGPAVTSLEKPQVCGLMRGVGGGT